MLLESITRLAGENNSQFAYRILKGSIMNFTLPPGYTINETEYVEMLSISRTPIREAIFKLRDEKLVDVFPQKSSHVSFIDLSLVDEGFFMRNALEREVTSMAVAEISPAELMALRENLALQEIVLKEYEDKSRFFLLDNEFHHIIYKCAKKPFVWETIKKAATHYDRLRYLDIIDKTKLDLIYSQHLEIYRHLSEHNQLFISEICSAHLTNYKEFMPHFLENYRSYFK